MQSLSHSYIGRHRVRRKPYKTHLGTFCNLLFYFRRELVKINKRSISLRFLIVVIFLIFDPRRPPLRSAIALLLVSASDVKSESRVLLLSTFLFFFQRNPQVYHFLLPWGQRGGSGRGRQGA